MASHDEFPAVGKVLKGTVDRMASGCAILELNCGVEAMLPFSCAKSVLRIGMELTVQVTSAEPHHRRGQNVSVEEV